MSGEIEMKMLSRHDEDALTSVLSDQQIGSELRALRVLDKHLRATFEIALGRSQATSEKTQKSRSRATPKGRRQLSHSLRGAAAALEDWGITAAVSAHSDALAMRIQEGRARGEALPASGLKRLSFEPVFAQLPRLLDEIADFLSANNTSSLPARAASWRLDVDDEQRKGKRPKPQSVLAFYLSRLFRIRAGKPRFELVASIINRAFPDGTIYTSELTKKAAKNFSDANPILDTLLI